MVHGYYKAGPETGCLIKRFAKVHGFVGTRPAVWCRLGPGPPPALAASVGDRSTCLDLSMWALPLLIKPLGFKCQAPAK